MKRSLWLSITAFVLGAGLLVASGIAGASTGQVAAKKGGTMKMNMSATDVDFTDPSLAYGTISWQIEYATALKLYNYPDKVATAGGSRIQPEGAAAFPVISKDGKTYTITVRSGYKFSDGSAVTAKNYVFALNRALSPTMQSPAAPFMTTIKGAQAVIDGKAKTASGVTVKGNKIVIKLAQPDGGLLAKLGMPFFQALKTNLALDKNGVNAYPSAGPYYISERTTGRHITVKRNPHYKGTRPANIDTFDITVNTNLDQSLLQTKSGQVDYDMGGLPATAHADLAQQFGINKSRYFVNQLVETDYVALNTARPTFGSVNMRKAANYAIDRPGMLRVRGAYAGKRTGQILPPNMGGFKRTKTYPLVGSNYAKAKELAGSNCKSVNLWTANSATGQNLAQVFKFNLSQIGCDVDVKLFQGFQIYTAAGQKGAEFDAVLVGWNQDYPDPYDFIDVLLNGDNIHDQNNNNLAYFNVPSINKEMAAANKLSGDKRYSTYGNLDVKITNNYAPWASYDNRNEREFVSARVGGYLFQPANASADLNTFFLK
jgi:ABC-type oligopeptide transport system substrate-binding subunit